MRPTEPLQLPGSAPLPRVYRQSAVMLNGGTGLVQRDFKAKRGTGRDEDASLRVSVAAADILRPTAGMKRGARRSLSSTIPSDDADAIERPDADGTR